MLETGNGMAEQSMSRRRQEVAHKCKWLYRQSIETEW